MARRGLTSTQALYLRLAGSASGDERLAALLAGRLDWATLRALARRDAVTGAVWRRLRAANADVPAVVADAFAREARVADFVQKRLEARLRDALVLLHGAGIHPVLMKGAGLAWSAYGGGLVERPAHDLDLLIAREELVSAWRLLSEAGWRPLTEGAQAAAYEGHHHLPPLGEPGGGPAVIELHGELFPEGHPFRIEAAALAAAARPLTTTAGEALVLPAEEQLLHACLHFAWSHELRWGAWRTIADVAAIVGAGSSARTDGDGDAGGTERRADSSEWRGARLQWARFLALARESRGGTACYWTLQLASSVGGAPVPQGALGALTPSLPAWAARWVQGRLVRQLLPLGRRSSVRVQRGVWRMALQPVRAGHGRSRPWRSGVGAEG